MARMAKIMRKTWRTIFIAIIGITIPFYLFGILYTLYRNYNEPTSSVQTVLTATRTPIDPNQLLTERALTDPARQASATPIVTVTTFNTGGITVIAPTAQATNPVFQPVPFTTATVLPTRFVTQIPTATATLINTPLPANTLPPSSTPQILLPPSDTPSP